MVRYRRGHVQAAGHIHRFPVGVCGDHVNIIIAVTVIQRYKRIINRTIRPLTNKDRKDVFIIDDTLFARTGGKRTAKVFYELDGKRRDIEVFFKTRKSMLRLGSERHSPSCDALNAHVSPVFVRYMLLSPQKRCSEDDLTIGELFLLMVDGLASPPLPKRCG